MKTNLIKYFKRDYTIDERIEVYDFIENFITQNVPSWDVPPDTDLISKKFATDIKTFNNEEFAFLLMTTGYIPEFYTHDSSQETLYTKLAEVLVCEWAIRIGFKDSNILKQKASKEDVSIRIDNVVIVCDTKTYRLGRSQAAPNVKDTIKKADYDKWQENYRSAVFEENTPYITKGGLITFPSLHRWKGSSDAYLYCTDKDDPILILFYEYMAFMLLEGLNHEIIINILTDYGKLFPKKTKSQSEYFYAILTNIFGRNYKSFEEFINFSNEVSNELVAHKVEVLSSFVENAKTNIEDSVNKMSVDEIKRKLVDAETKIMSEQIAKQLENINKFRRDKELKSIHPLSDF